jgi:hypothetical protein
MRRTKLIVGVLGLMMAMMVAFAAPAMAQDLNFDGFDDDDGFFFIVDDFDNDDFDRNDFCFDDDFFFDDDFCFDDRNDFFDDDGFFFDEGFQSFDQEADSGDIDQSFDVSGGGDNANQTVNVSGTANTGNIQDQFGFTQIGSEIDEFEIDGGGSSIEVGGDSDVSSSQEVNQAASSG